MIIGIDPHKLSHTATAVDRATNTAISSLRVGASLAGYRELLGWARQFPDRCWAIENAKGLGCHLAQWLVALGEEVVAPIGRDGGNRQRATRSSRKNIKRSTFERRKKENLRSAA